MGDKEENLDINEAKIFANILISKKKQEVDFDAWLKSQGCILTSLNEFMISCFNDKNLQKKYFAVKYPPYTYEEYFPKTSWTTTANTKGASIQTSGYTKLTYSDEGYQVIKIILFPKEKVKKILSLNSF